MRKILIFTIALLAMVAVGFGQANASWEKWNWLIGEWKGEGSGQPGAGAGTCSFSFDLDKKIIVRKNHAEYPATDKKPLVIHDDLMIVYLDFTGAPTKAIYFDNENHTINYTISYFDKSIVMTSEKIPNVPFFRLTYFLDDNQVMSIRFEMSQDGEKYITYTEGKCKKIR